MTSKIILLFQILVFIFIGTHHISALKCYTCTVAIGDVDQRCVTNPGSVEGQNIVNCNKIYCTSKRVEYKDPPGQVHSMHRGCDSDPERMNTIEEDDTFITYYRACTKNLCNDGNGKGSEGGTGFDPETGEEGVLIVKGNNSAERRIGNMAVIVGIFCWALFENRLL